MVYADTDFFLALLKASDWLQEPARRLITKFRGTIWISPAVLTELLVLAFRLKLDPERLMIHVLAIAELREGQPNVFLLAAHYMNERDVAPFDAIHAAFCTGDSIISSDKVFDKLGLKRIPLAA